MKTSFRQPRSMTAIAIAVALMLSGCASRLSDAEVIAQNASPGTNTGDVAGPAGEELRWLIRPLSSRPVR